MNKDQEHIDLEERFLLAVKVEFETAGATFEGLNPMDMGTPKKKTNNETKITNVELRPTKGGLF